MEPPAGSQRRISTTFFPAIMRCTDGDTMDNALTITIDLLPSVVWWVNVGAPAACAFKVALSKPVFDGIPPLDEVWGFQMLLECILVCINFIKPNTIRIGTVLNYIKSQTTGFIRRQSLLRRLSWLR